MKQRKQRNDRARLYAAFFCLGLAVVLLGAISFSLWMSFARAHNGPLTNIFPSKQSTCKTPHHDPGDITLKMTSVGLERSYLVHLPPSYGQDPQPLVINYHGYGKFVEQYYKATGLVPVADRAGFIVVFPQGYGDQPSWNAGNGAYGPTGDTDDIQFTRDLLASLKKNFCVNPQQVYLTGFSIGGGMAYRAVCAMSDEIAAIATNAGAYYAFPEVCQPAKTVPVIEVHADTDDQAWYNGNPNLLTASVADYLQGWLDRDKCQNNPVVVFQKNEVTGKEWKQCADGAAVSHYLITGGRHSWTVLPNGSQTIDTSSVVWEFLRRFKRPDAK